MTEKFSPEPGDKFMMQWKTLDDRSYTSEVWQCIAENEIAVIAKHFGRPRYFSNQILLPRIDVNFFTVTDEFATAYLQGQGVRS